MKHLFIILFFFIFLWGCYSIPESKNKIDYTKVPNHSQRLEKSEEVLVLDTIRINSWKENELNSMEGTFFIQDDTLFFADDQLATLFLYDLNGKFITTRLSQGRGPQEILDLNTITPLPEGGCAIMDGQWNIYLFDKYWHGPKSYTIDWQNKKSLKQLLQAPGPDESGIYEVEYALNILRYLGNKYLVFPIVTECKGYNSYSTKDHAEHFYENTYTLGIIDINNGKLVKMLCNHSPIYQKYRYVPNFKFNIFDTYNDTIFYSFTIDTLIYQMNYKDSTLFSFGYAGKNMNTDYRETKSLQEADDFFFDDLNTYGYYYYIKYIPETNLLFRGYHCGNTQKEDGLQVYRNNTLISEFNVPKDFRVFGYHTPYYYATGPIDYEKEQMLVYKFKLPE